MEVSAIKSRLRANTRAVLKSLSPTFLLENSEKIAKSLFEVAAFREAKALSCFISMPNEVQTNPILESVLDAGYPQVRSRSSAAAATSTSASPPYESRHLMLKRVFVPKVTGSKSPEMTMVELKGLRELESTNYIANHWGIREPVHSEPDYTCEGVIDLVLVPGVAFDAQCHRLGQGRGYYDSFLQRAIDANESKGLARPCTVGLCFDEQVLRDGEHVPVQEHDIPLDYIVTPSRIIQRQQPQPEVQLSSLKV